MKGRESIDWPLSDGKSESHKSKMLRLEGHFLSQNVMRLFKGLLNLSMFHICFTIFSMNFNCDEASIVLKIL